MRITMIGHSTVLIETNGKKILTDPYFGGPRYSPAQVHDNSPPVLLINDMIQTALIGIKRFVFAG